MFAPASAAAAAAAAAENSQITKQLDIVGYNYISIGY